ncbi:polysaccharide deacetylase family protein [Hyphobacterium sp.]|jgi:peptidoglycan/xylan/chitin deacetylase (PgdA/CDA1 family)|uniref:polysaccharide deacetylase family protein n=1 Tax=Hyphobacterium sp. TaxID=2004662 RepID=UPI003BAAC106
MNGTAYIPSSGLAGKWRRLSARLFERDPLRINASRLTVSFTFDDFPKSAVEHGAAELESRNWRGTWYAATGMAGSENHHGRLFDAADIQRLAAAGHEIACHTHSHIDMAAAEPGTVMADIKANHAALADMGHRHNLPAFAYPFGESTPRMKRALSARYETLRGVQPGINRTGDDRHLLKAVGIDGGDAGIDRALAFIDDGMRKPGWLIFYAHDIRENPTDWGCTPEQFREICDAVADSGADVIPVTEAYRSLVRE